MKLIPRSGSLEKVDSVCKNMRVGLFILLTLPYTYLLVVENLRTGGLLFLRIFRGIDFLFLLRLLMDNLPNWS